MNIYNVRINEGENMIWIDNLNKTIEYIEEHLTEKIDYERLAQIAACPQYYLQKTFLYMTNMSINEYIRRRRMSLAAVDLQHTQLKIIDIALKYGYESPTAFNRAFQSVHGFAPSLVRKNHMSIKSYPAMKFNFSIQGREALNYRIEEKEEFRVIGKSYPLSKDLTENFKYIPTKWDESLTNGTLIQLSKFMDQEPYSLLGVSIHYLTDWRYMIAVKSHKINSGFDEYIIPSATWAIFSGKGTNKSLQELEQRVIMEWLPTSGYQYANIPDIEVYLKADPNDTIYEYWLPVIKNKEKE